MESGFRFRFVALSSFAVEDCTFYISSRSILAACMPVPMPVPAHFLGLSHPVPPHPTSLSSVLASHPYLYSRRHHHTLHYLPLPLPFLRPFISRHPSASANPVPKDSSRAAVTYFTFSFSFFCFISIMLQGKVAYIVTYMLIKGISFRCVLGVDMRNSNCTFWNFDLVMWVNVYTRPIPSS